MKEKLDIHKYDYRLELANNRLERNFYNISEKNIKTIFKFRNYLNANSYSKGRIHRYLQLLPQLAQWLKKDFDQVNKDDMLKVLSSLQKRGYTANTKETYKAVIKRFYKWLLGGDEKYPSCVDWIKNKRTTLNRLPEELLTKSIQKITYIP